MNWLDRVSQKLKLRSLSTWPSSATSFLPANSCTKVRLPRLQEHLLLPAAHPRPQRALAPPSHDLLPLLETQTTDSLTRAVANIGIPTKLLHESLGHVITVELKTGQVYRGKLFDGERAFAGFF